MSWEWTISEFIPEIHAFDEYTEATENPNADGDILFEDEGS
jgi:hypothetical protein